MKICMLAFSHNPYDGRIYYKEAKSLAKHGYSVLILSLYEGKRQKPSDKNIKVKYIEAFHKNMYILFFIKLYVLFREAIKVNADIYHCHEPESHIIGMAIKILKRKKLILDVHEFYPDVIEMGGRYYKYVYMLTCYLLEPLLCWMDDYIICADDEIKKMYQRFNRKVISLFNYPITELWELYDRGALEMNRTNPTLIYAGYICENNGIWLMLEVFGQLLKKFVNVRLLLIGDSSDDLKREIDEYITARNLADYVKYIGSISTHEVPKYLKSANVGLLLYHPIRKYTKNIPTKQFEYAISELPYVGSDLPPIKKFIDDAKCGLLVPPCNIEVAAYAIRYILTHPEEAKEMGKNGKRAVYEKYNWASMEQALIGVYSQV